MEAKCKNCNSDLSGKYCANCGQEAAVRRITWEEISHMLPHALFHVNRGLFFTIKELFARPGYAVKDYIEGKRVNYSNPVLYIVLLGGFTTLFYNFFDVPLNVEGVDIHQMLRSNNLFTNKYFIIKTIAIIPLIASICCFLFREFRFNFPEYIVMASFMTGQMIVLILLFFPLSLAMKGSEFHALVRYANLLAFSIYAGVFLFQFFDAKGNKTLIIKVVAATFLMMAVFIGLSKYLQVIILE